MNERIVELQIESGYSADDVIVTVKAVETDV
jgi:hypothetical protein